MRKFLFTAVICILTVAILPNQVFAAAPKIVKISAEGMPTIHKSDGSVWIFGDRNSIPTRMRQIHDVVKVIPHKDIKPDYSYGHVYSFVLHKDGSLWKYPTDASLTPEQVSEFQDIVDIGAGNGFYVALKSDGTVWTWGKNDYGQLGNGKFEDTISEVPQQIKELSSIVSIAVSNDFSLALTEDGKVYSWGWWSQGAQIAHFSRVYSRTKPVRVYNLPPVVVIDAGNLTAMAADAEGDVYTWGSNILRLKSGDKYHNFIQIPQKIEGLSDVVDIGVGGVNLFLTRNGEVWHAGLDWNLHWRERERYQSSLKPAPIPSLSNAIQIAVGPNYRMVLDTDGNAFAWGNAIDGQLGTGKVGWGKWELDPVPLLYPVLIFMNGEEQPYSGILHKGITQVPLRKLANQLGGKLSYDHHSKTVTLTKGNQLVSFRPGDSAIQVNGELIHLGGAIQNYNNETYVPLRLFSELFGAKVEWSAEQGMIIIKTVD